MWARLKRRLFSKAPVRRVSRHPLPDVVAFHWTGGSPREFKIGNISATGMFLLTEDRWFPGTVILMTLQRTWSHNEKRRESIAVLTNVVRTDDDGMGLEFIFSGYLDLPNNAMHPEAGASREALERFLLPLNLVQQDEMVSRRKL